MVTNELEWFPYSDIFLIENVFFQKSWLWAWHVCWVDVCSILILLGIFLPRSAVSVLLFYLSLLSFTTCQTSQNNCFIQ